jgi:hypothetical protein
MGDVERGGLKPGKSDERGASHEPNEEEDTFWEGTFEALGGAQSRAERNAHDAAATGNSWLARRWLWIAATLGFLIRILMKTLTD